MRPRERSRLPKFLLTVEMITAAFVVASSPAKAGPLDAFAMVPPANEQLQPPAAEPDQGAVELPENLQRQVVSYRGSEAAGTIIIDTPHTYLYLVLGSGRAMRYGIGVGREGFTWSGVQQIRRKTERSEEHTSEPQSRRA